MTRIALAPPLVLALLLAPAPAEAGKLAAAYAEAVLTPVSSFVGGTTRGPASTRATWVALGDIKPFEGQAMAVFSTGDLETPAIPGTDLGTVGPAVDINIQLELVLQPPDWARSLRFAYAAIAPATWTPEQAAAVVADACSVSLSTQIAVDPWTLSDLTPESAAFAQGPAGALDDVPWLDGTHATGWIEAVVPVRPELGNLTFVFHAEEGGDDPLMDLVCLLDGVSFDRGIPVGVGPGTVPRVSAIRPAVVPPGTVTAVVVEGRDLPLADVTFSLLGADGVVEGVLTPLDTDDPTVPRSSERVVLALPALTNGLRGLRITWSGGAMTWEEAFEVRTVPPRIETVRPAVGPPEGGNRIAIQGSGFHDVTSVSIGDRQATADDIVVLSPQQLEVLVPGPGIVVGLVDVRLTAGGLNTTAPDAYTLAATETETAETEIPGPPPPSTACSHAAGSPIRFAWLLPLALRRQRRQRRGRHPS